MKRTVFELNGFKKKGNWHTRFSYQTKKEIYYCAAGYRFTSATSWSIAKLKDHTSEVAVDL